MKHEEVVFVLDMAPHTKCTLTSIERLAIQKANALHAQAAKTMVKEKAAEKGNEKKQK